MRYFKYIGLSVLVVFVLSGCAPSISDKETRHMEEHSKPGSRHTSYSDGLDSLGRVINSGIGSKSYCQVQKIENKAGAAKLQEEVTDMVLNSVNTLAGARLNVVPPSRDYKLIQEVPIHQNFRPQMPNVIIAGAITEFDEDISVKDSGWGLEGYIPTNIEGEDVDIDIMAEFSKAETISRIAIDLRLMNYTTRVVFPKMHVSNTILVFEMEKERNLGFMIYGSGLTRTGSISVRQGLHQAVRNLIDYSVLQLFGTFYSIPYWKALGSAEPQRGQYWYADARQQFLNLSGPNQVGQIQHWLTKYSLKPVYVDGALIREIPQAEYGKFAQATQAFSLQYLYQYDPASAVVPYVERGNFPQNNGLLGDLYLSLIKHIPISLRY